MAKPHRDPAILGVQKLTSPLPLIAVSPSAFEQIGDRLLKALVAAMEAEFVGSDPSSLAKCSGVILNRAEGDTKQQMEL